MKLRSISQKILSPKSAERACKSARSKKKRVVFTNGCFDILHEGHVQYLQDARKKGDFLIVALDTDQAVRKLKGPSRPVNSLSSRLAVIAALESVDAVTWFSGGNPLPTIKKLRPAVLVKGGDWKIPQIIGSKEVLGWKGKVFSLPFVEGKSTSKIISTIVSRNIAKR